MKILGEISHILGMDVKVDIPEPIYVNNNILEILIIHLKNMEFIIIRHRWTLVHNGDN